jgi:hypothetical protein
MVAGFGLDFRRRPAGNPVDCVVRKNRSGGSGLGAIRMRRRRLRVAPAEQPQICSAFEVNNFRVRSNGIASRLSVPVLPGCMCDDTVWHHLKFDLLRLVREKEPACAEASPQR